MSKIKKAILIVVTLLVVTVLLLQIDDELSPDASEMIEAVDWQSENEAYLYLLGIGAKLGDAPLDEGALVLSLIRKSEDDYQSEHAADSWGTYEARPTLRLPKCNSFCSVNESDCIDSLFKESAIDLDDPLIVEVKNRYETFLNIRGFTTMTQPHLFEPFANFTFLVEANKLMSLSAIRKARDCCPEEAMNDLYALIELQKKHIAESDILIGRMIAYVLLNETVDVLSLLIEEFDLDGKPIELLTPEQLDLDRVINREFAYSYSGISLQYSHGDRARFPKWSLKTFIKQNMTINASLPNYKRAKSLSLLPQVDFTHAVPSSSDNSLSIMSRIRNFYGSLFYFENHLDPYVARGFDLNSKIVLFNGLLGEPLSNDVLSGILNPYYSDQYDAWYDAENKRVCFGGPFEMSGFTRCVITFKEYK